MERSSSSSTADSSLTGFPIIADKMSFRQTAPKFPSTNLFRRLYCWTANASVRLMVQSICKVDRELISYANACTEHTRSWLLSSGCSLARFRALSSNRRVLLNIRKLINMQSLYHLACVLLKYIFTKRNPVSWIKEFEGFTSLRDFSDLRQFTSSWNFPYSHN